jgi:hypothetical protein
VLGVRAEADSVALTKALVRQCQGHRILPHASVENEVARGELSRRVIDNPLVFADLSLVMDAGARRDPPIREMAREIQALLQSLGRSGAWPGALVLQAEVRLRHRNRSDHSALACYRNEPMSACVRIRCQLLADIVEKAGLERDAGSFWIWPVGSPRMA